MSLAVHDVFHLSARLSHLRKWVEEGAGEMKATKRGRGEDRALFVESGAEAKGRGIPGIESQSLSNLATTGMELG